MTVMVTTLDALGVCGGSCDADADGDGVCDDVEMTVLVHTTTVEYVTVLEQYTSVDVLIYQKETVTVTETSLMSVVFVVVMEFQKVLVTVMETCQMHGYDCDGNCLTDTDGDGVCDEFEIEVVLMILLVTTTMLQQMTMDLVNIKS